MLRDMSGRLEAGDAALDVGANICNHSPYLAAVCSAKLTAFESNARLAAALARSVELNGLQSRISVRTLGVGATAGPANFAEEIPENLGRQSLIGDRDGIIRVEPLDEQLFPEHVRMIKIDVVGMELDVITGAQILITRDRPVIYVESTTESQYRQMITFFKNQNYVYWDTFNATPTHLLLPSETVSAEHHLQHLKMREVLETYRNATDKSNLTDALNNSNEKYRTVAQQLT